jgi:hypothetical protein
VLDILILVPLQSFYHSGKVPILAPLTPPKFKYLGDLTCIFPNAAHLAVTATATPKYIHMLGNVLKISFPSYCTNES